MRQCVLAVMFQLFAQLAYCQGTPPAPTAATAATVSEPVTAGKVDLVEGDVRFLDTNRRMRRPKVGDPIFEGENIITGSEGEVHVLMEDGGYIGVRPGTKMRIVKFQADGDATDRSVMRLLEGSFRSVTGWIAKLGPNTAVIRTATATIGIRGTEHEPLVIPEGSKLGEPGTYDRVYIGETQIRTAQGVTSVGPNQAGFVPNRGAARPRVLDSVPGFFRPTRNEGRFDGLHERIHKQLNERREQRHQLTEQHRKQQIGPAQQGAGAKAQRQPKGPRPHAEKFHRK